MPEVKNEVQDFRKTLWFKALTECFGTFLLVAVGVLIGTLCSNLGGTWSQSNGANIMTVCLAWGLAVTALCYTLGPISGCHLNPSVSIAMAIQKKITWVEFVVYVISQIIGAFLGALVIWAMLDGAKEGGVNPTVSSTMVSTSGALAVAGGEVGGLFVGGVLELIGTFLLVFFILFITSDPKYSALAGIAIGLILWLAIAILFNFTGGSLNAARSLGTALVALFNGETGPISQIWVYLIFPTAGGALAAFADKLFHKPAVAA